MLDSLYENIGGKIKNCAKWIFVIEAIATIIGGIGLIADDFGLEGFLLMIIGPLVAWVCSWLLYGFGELIETNAETRDLTAKLLQYKSSAPSTEGPEPVTAARQTAAPNGSWVCACGRTNDSHVSTCVCGLTEYGASLIKKN